VFFVHKKFEIFKGIYLTGYEDRSIHVSNGQRCFIFAVKRLNHTKISHILYKYRPHESNAWF